MLVYSIHYYRDLFNYETIFRPPDYFTEIQKFIKSIKVHGDSIGILKVIITNSIVDQVILEFLCENVYGGYVLRNF